MQCRVNGLSKNVVCLYICSDNLLYPLVEFESFIHKYIAWISLNVFLVVSKKGAINQKLVEANSGVLY